MSDVKSDPADAGRASTAGTAAGTAAGAGIGAPGSEASEPAVVARAAAVNADALKAFAHPLRMAMLDHLLERGPATATQLARALDESTGQTSYHLRQLHRHGFVEDDPTHSGGRERWWRAVPFSIDGSVVREVPGGADAIIAAKRWAVAERVRVLSRWAELTDPDPEWVDVGTSSRATGDLTAPEAEELAEELQTVVLTHMRAAKARRAAEGAGAHRRVRVYIDVLPLPADDAADDVGDA